MTNKATYKFYRDEGLITFTSDFDNGNIGKVSMITSTTVITFHFNK